MGRKGIGIIRVSGKKQLQGYTVQTQKLAIEQLCKDNDIELIGIKKYLAVSGRKEDSIESYMSQIKNIIKKYNANCLILAKTSRLGRIMPEIYNNVKDLIDNYVDTIYTANLTINKDNFIFFSQRCMLYVTFMLDEAEGYSIYERMFEGRKTKNIMDENNV